jgi:hypothetical protein
MTIILQEPLSLRTIEEHGFSAPASTARIRNPVSSFPYAASLPLLTYDYKRLKSVGKISG